MRRRRAALGIAVGWTLATGCYHGRPPPQRVDVDLRAPTSQARITVRDTPQILSAHLALADAEPLEGRDAVVVVFNVEVDAASLRPEVFWVSLGNGDRARAAEAVLAPANEDDENRTVLLVGEFGSATDNPPVSVAVFGNLYTEDGGTLGGLAADIWAFDTPGSVVAAVRIAPAPGRCEGAPAVVRTYWIDDLRGVDNQDKALLRLTLDDGTTVVPDGFDDHDPAREASADNVLDLCLPHAGRAVHLRVEPGAFADAAGHPSGAVDVEIGDAVTHEGPV
jgi:hypothetical protein